MITLGTVPDSCPACGGEVYVCRKPHVDGPHPRIHCKEFSYHNFRLDEMPWPADAVRLATAAPQDSARLPDGGSTTVTPGGAP